MCFDSNGTMARNQAEFDQNFNSSTGLGAPMAGFGKAMLSAYNSSQPVKASAPQQAPTSAPFASAYNTPQPAPQQTQVPGGAPYPSVYTNKDGIGSVFRDAGATAPRGANGSGRVIG